MGEVVSVDVAYFQQALGRRRLHSDVRRDVETLLRDVERGKRVEESRVNALRRRVAPIMGQRA